MTVRELVNELTASYVDWDKEISIHVSKEPLKSGKVLEWDKYNVDRCSLHKPLWHVDDTCILVIGE